MAHASFPTFGALATPPPGLAGHGLPDESLRHAPTHRDDDAAVLVTHDERRLPREQPLGRVHIRATNACGAHLDHYLPQSWSRLGYLVDTESVSALPRRDLH